MTDRFRIRDGEHADMCNRVDVFRTPWAADYCWTVWVGHGMISEHVTHADAIIAAQRIAQEKE